MFKSIIFFMLISSIYLQAKEQKIDFKVSVMSNTCFTCHGSDKENKSCSVLPPIVGQDVDYMIKTLMNFKKDENASIDMYRHIKGYTDKEIEDIAVYLNKVK